jgi:hypothetical protein
MGQENWKAARPNLRRRGAGMIQPTFYLNPQFHDLLSLFKCFIYLFVYLFIFVALGIEPKGLAHARQALYYLSHTPGPFWFVFCF